MAVHPHILFMTTPYLVQEGHEVLEEVVVGLREFVYELTTHM